MIDDPYLLLELFTFLSIRDSISFSRTCRLFTDKLLTDELTKRIGRSVCVQFTPCMCGNHAMQTAYMLSGKTHIVFPFEDRAPLPDEKICIRVRTPNWQFEWSGYLDLNNDASIVNVGKTGFASIYLQLYYDSGIVYVDGIHIEYVTNLEQYLWWHYFRRYVYSICLVAASISTGNFILSIVLCFYALLCSSFMTRSVKYEDSEIQLTKQTM